LDWLIVLNERHLRSNLKEWVTHEQNFEGRVHFEKFRRPKNSPLEATENVWHSSRKSVRSRSGGYWASRYFVRMIP